jgi:hypothetical protein
MAGDEISISFTNQVGSFDRIRTKTQVGFGHLTGFFRVIDKITLCKVASFFTDDLGGVLVCPHGTIRT